MQGRADIDSELITGDSIGKNGANRLSQWIEATARATGRSRGSPSKYKYQEISMPHINHGDTDCMMV